MKEAIFLVAAILGVVMLASILMAMVLYNSISLIVSLGFALSFWVAKKKKNKKRTLFVKNYLCK
jgi:hypothetical protein